MAVCSAADGGPADGGTQLAIAELLADRFRKSVAHPDLLVCFTSNYALCDAAVSALELTGRAFVPSPRLAWSSPLSAGLADVPEVEDWASKVAAMLLEVDPELGAFKELLARREDKEWGVLTSALRVVGSMPNSVLRLLRDDLVRISTAHDGHDEQSCTAGQRKLARQMLIDLDFSTVSSGRRCSW